MSTIKKIKNNLQQQKIYKQYTSTFKNKQMHFLLSKLDCIFSNNNNIDKLTKIEIDVCNDASNELTWVNLVNDLSKDWLNEYRNIKWSEFGSFLFYVYNYSEFYIKKSTLKNIYNIDNFIDIDDTKRHHFNLWLNSMYESGNSHFNSYVIKVLELIK